MRKNAMLVLLCLMVSLACSSIASTQRDATEKRITPAAAAAPPAAAAPVAPAPTSTAAVTDFRRLFVNVAKAVRPSVVSITSVSTVELEMPGGGNPFDLFFRGAPRPEGKQKRQGMGTGVIVDKRGYILTNNHVVADADELKVVMQDNREYAAEVVGTDPKTDIAVIKVKLDDKQRAAGLPPAALGNSDSLEVGEWVMAIGSPFGLTQTVSAGIVSAIGRGHMGIADYEDFIQTDAAINPGNSGGPLVNLDGRVVAINTAIASRSGGSQGVGFAIPINMAKAVMDQLIDHGEMVRGYLGVYIADVSPELASSFGYDGKGGVLVQEASLGSPGAKAGLLPGDIIVARDGKPVDEVVGFRNGIAQTKPGSSITLTIVREGKKQTLKATLDALPAEQGVAKKGKPGAPTENGRGLGLADITPEWQQRFGLSDARGAVVVQVRPDSASATAGLQPGDVIVQIGSSNIANVKDAQRLLTQGDTGKPVRLRVLREGHGMFLILPPSKSK